jgi:hypothetical protein
MKWTQLYEPSHRASLLSAARVPGPEGRGEDEGAAVEDILAALPSDQRVDASNVRPLRAT